jgi:hypothetical protein
MHPRLSDRELVNIGAHNPRGKTAYVINPGAGETMPALTWQTQPNGIQYLSARFSLPRQRWGHNARLPARQVDVFAGLGIAADAIHRATGIMFNPLTANVTDVHYAMDIHVGTERVRPILDRLEMRQLPRRKRIRLDYGVEFKQRQSSTQIYAKFIEIQMQIEKGHIISEHHYDALQAAHGVLRVEHRQHLPALQRSQTRNGLSRVAADVLTPKASYRMIADALDKLQFSDAVNNAETDQELDRLIRCHGDKIAMRLFGFLKMVKSYGTDFWRVRNYARRTYYDNLRLCKAAGVWAVDK